MQSFAIVLLSIVSAVAYGIVHDQVTVRVSLEYFTVGHPRIFGTNDPTLLALGWGVVATWWVGLLLGIPLAIAARAGSRPKRSAASLVRPIACLLAVMAVCALVAGVLGYALGRAGVVFLTGPVTHELLHQWHVPFLACRWAHSASYLAGFVGGAVVLVVVWRSRRPVTS